MGKIALANVSLVVAAEQHNPTVLHPAFLQAEGVVPADWEITEGPICTPAISMVSFAERFTFRVEPPRLEIVDDMPRGNGTGSPVCELAEKYVQKLPHVHYKAVGANFSAFYHCEDPDTFMLRRFLKPDTSKNWEPEPVSMGVQLSFPVTHAMFHLTLRPGREQGAHDSPRGGIVLGGNCHAETTTAEEVTRAIGNFDSNITAALAVCSRVLAANGED